MELFLLLWYLGVSLVSWLALHSESFVFLRKISKEVRAERGILLVQLVATWIVVIAPSYLQENSMGVLRDIVEPNLLTVGLSMLMLVLAALFIPYTFHLRQEKNYLGATISLVLSIAALVVFAILLVVVLPLEVAQCPCLEGFYGTNCDKSCLDNSGVICSGHGKCTSTGCLCEERFQGDLCDSCINEYLYESDCSSCRFGYSLTFDCTRCEVGRDPATDCQVCVDAYVNTNNSFVCDECKAFFFKPSALPSRESYNAFLRVGSDECTACPEKNGLVCSGHGQCQHYQLATEEGILGDDANGRCECVEGYFGEYCDRIWGYDGLNAESICNGHGTPIATYEQVELYEEFTEIVCKCEDGFAPSAAAENACSEAVNDIGQITGCIYGYYLAQNGTCIACPGGGFLQGCNAGRGAGTCSEEGTCTCFVNYDQGGSGGYIGADCEECAPNFYQDGTGICKPCPQAYGPLVQQACGGKGFCITATRTQHWMDGLGTDTDADSYAAYSAQVDTVVDLGELSQYLGQCLCRSGYSQGLDGSCR